MKSSIKTGNLFLLGPFLPTAFCLLLGLGMGVAQTEVLEAAKEDAPRTSVQIINTTSVPEVEVSIDGTPVYRSFPQGIYSNAGTTTMLKQTYTVKDKASNTTAEYKAEYVADNNQILVMIGDFAIKENPEDYLPGVLSDKAPGVGMGKKPNVLFLQFDNKLAKDVQPLRFRVINGMPGTSMTVEDKETKVVLKPGEVHELTGRSAVDNIPVTINDKPYPVFMNQAGSLRNCTIVFYLTKDGPAFLRIYESTHMSNKNVTPKSEESQ